MCLLLSDFGFLGILQGRFGRFANLLLCCWQRKHKATVSSHSIYFLQFKTFISSLVSSDVKYQMIIGHREHASSVAWFRDPENAQSTIGRRVSLGKPSLTNALRQPGPPPSAPAPAGRRNLKLGISGTKHSTFRFILLISLIIK